MKILKRYGELNNLFLCCCFFCGVFLFACQREVIEFSGNQQKIEVPHGSKFKLVLNEDHAKGQNWVVVQNFDIKKLTYLKSNFHGPQQGKTDFIFTAEEIGRTKIQFNLIEYGEVKLNRKIIVDVK